MVDNSENGFYQLNKFFKKISLKKMHVKKIKNRILFLNQILKQNYKKLNNKTSMISNVSFLVGYIIKIHFSKANSFTQITNSFGGLKLSYSAGSFLYKGKNKKARTLVLKKLTSSLVKRLDILKNKAVVLHLKNTRFKKTWIVSKLGQKTIIKNAVGFNLYSHNGCRKKKIGSKRI